MFSVDTAFFLATGCSIFFPSAFICCFLTKILFLFFTQNALERSVQLQFAYWGPQGTVKLFMCEYLTNKQIACWQGELQRGDSNLAEGEFLASSFAISQASFNFQGHFCSINFLSGCTKRRVHIRVSVWSQPCINEFSDKCDKTVCVINNVPLSQASVHSTSHTSGKCKVRKIQ